MDHKGLLFDKIYGCLLGGVIGDAMGAPVENWHYRDIAEKFGEVRSFSGEGTDDSAIRIILCDAILQSDGYVTADEFAASFLRYPQYKKLFFIPVLNMYHKIQDELVLPVYAGLGNMQSSSSAMCISPMGIINACNPRQAALETYDVAGLIHGGESSTFCRDAACIIAAAVAEAMSPDANVQSILDASLAYLHPKSSAFMWDHTARILEMAKAAGNYQEFRSKFYELCLQNVICDSRETVPATLAIIYLSKGNPEQSLINGVNFGRDADTIGTMIGSIVGALHGASKLPLDWVNEVAHSSVQKEMANKLMNIVLMRAAHASHISETLFAMQKMAI